MIKTLLDKISISYKNAVLTDRWMNSACGEIVDINGDGNYRFVDFINDEDGNVRQHHLHKEDEMKCPIVATGFVAYWLKNNSNMGVRDIFNNYYELKMSVYEQEHKFDDDAWERDLKKEFVCRYHIPTEKKWIKVSEALFEYVTESDKKKILSITNNYLKFARSKRKELYPPNHPANRMIEDTFLDAYRMGGAAYECMRWMRIEYNLPNMGPHWHEDGKTEKEMLTGRWKEHHEVVIPEYVREQFEDFDDGVLMYTNGGLMDEIHENLKNCQTDDDRIRYIISLLQPFKEFAEAFYSKAQRDERERSIAEHEVWIKNWEATPDDAIDEISGKPIRPKEQIKACITTIERYRKDIAYWKQVQDDFFWFAQHGLGAGEYRIYPQPVNDDMCKYLGGWWRCMIYFSRHLAALVLSYGIKLMDVQEKCGIYLMWHFMTHDYVDNHFITSIEHARHILHEIEPQNTSMGNREKKGNEDKELEIIKEFFKEYKLFPNKSNSNTPSVEKVYEEVLKICEIFKDFVEKKQLSNMFYKNARKPDETDWQYLLYTIACCYQEASNGNYHISREDNPGNGEIDMHFTRGNEVNICLEIKRSGNNQILHGYKEQLPGYMKAENAQKGIFIIIEEEDNNKTQIKNVIELEQKIIAEGKEAIKVIVVNGRRQVSASNPLYRCPD